MNFFEQQDRRRKNTTYLVVLFGLTLLLLVFGTYVTLLLSLSEYIKPRLGWWQPKILFYSAISISACVGIGFAQMWNILRVGGKSVAERMGAFHVDSRPPGVETSRLRNVVEEMALASGTPVPEIYVLEGESGINAFAAGFAPSDAAVVVTEGALKMLKRDELQGVIGHEFSHILNGDMKLNLRMMAVVNGLVIISVAGRMLCRATRGSRKEGQGLLLFGVFLILVGSVGVFFGRLIKYAVSRQRELLADASAVQFTRNNNGLIGALKKIGGDRWGSRVNNPNTEEVSHMFFANPFRFSFASLFSTHPKIAERIRLLEPTFDGKFPETRKDEALPGQPTKVLEPIVPPAMTAAFAAMSVAEMVRRVGAPQPEHVDEARAFLNSIPGDLRKAFGDPASAKEIVFALIIEGDEGTRGKQRALLAEQLGTDSAQMVVNRYEEIAKLGGQKRLSLLDLSIPALRRLPKEEILSMLSLVKDLCVADEKVSLFEFAAVKALKRSLAGSLGEKRRRPPQFYNVATLLPECSVLLSAIAHAGESDPVRAEGAYLAGSTQLTIYKMPLLSLDQCGLVALDHALDKLLGAVPKVKQKVFTACATTALYDRIMTPEEYELLRAVGDALECPLPPALNEA